jgi:hypothetical protein
MLELKAGTRLRSVVCDTEVMVILAPAAAVDLRCGGLPMAAIDAETPAGASLDPAAASGTMLGKRYVSDSGDLEVLCTKPGEGTLALAATPLALKEAKPLPSSD